MVQTAAAAEAALALVSVLDRDVYLWNVRSKATGRGRRRHHEVGN